MHLTNVDNWQNNQANINTYLGGKNNDVDDRLANFEKSIKNLGNIDNKINKIMDDYKPKTEIEYDVKKGFLLMGPCSGFSVLHGVNPN